MMARVGETLRQRGGKGLPPFHHMGTCNLDTREVPKTTATHPVAARLRPFRSDETLSRSSHQRFLEGSFT